MITGITCSVALATQIAVGGLGLFDCLLKKDSHSYRGAECCQSCFSEASTLQNLLVVVEHHSGDKARLKAVKSLRKYDWRCHPELVPALSTVLLNDCDKKVRKEAAETLARFGTCDPTAQAALEQSAISDPDHSTRKQSRKALDRLGRGCGTACPMCSPMLVSEEAVIVPPHPVEYEVEVLPPSRAPRVYGEVPYDRVAPLYERRLRGLPPQGYGEIAPPGVPLMPDPDAPPGLLPPAVEPFDEGPIEVVPPDELPVPNPPSASPFGTSSRTEESPRPPARRDGPFRIFTSGRSR